MSDFVEIPPVGNPARLLEAVAKMGYDPEVALCDLMDNCIDAKANTIEVYLTPDVESDSDIAYTYTVVDNGCGMSRDMLKKSLALGVETPHVAGALGKFGLGLKSAGLSLGNKITIITKEENNEQPHFAILDMEHIREVERYEVAAGDVLAPDLQKIWDRSEALKETGHGTIVIITDLIAGQKVAKWQDYFRRYCSIAFHLLMEEDSLKIIVNGDKLEPVDPLFLNEARVDEKFVPETWDGKTPYHIFNKEDERLDDGIRVNVDITHLIHPPTFQEKQSEMRTKYLIGSDPDTGQLRHGFNIYRNRRVIVPNERFRGVVPNSQSHWAFRGRLMFNESADSSLSLDVKKRHCILPSMARNNFKNMIHIYLQMSRKAWKHATDTVTSTQSQSSHIGETPVTSLMYNVGLSLDQGERRELRKKFKEIEQATGELIGDDENKRAIEESKQIVVNLPHLSGHLWVPYPGLSSETAKVALNDSHLWASAVKRMNDVYSSRLFDYFLLIISRAELLVRSQSKEVSPDVAEKVMHEFRKWASRVAEDLVDAFEKEINELGGIDDDGD